MRRDDAEREIAAILKALEVETDCVVETVTLHDFEVTQMEDTRQMFSRRVVIELKRLPGHHWYTG